MQQIISSHQRISLSIVTETIDVEGNMSTFSTAYQKNITFWLNLGTRKGAWSPKYTAKNVPLGTEQFIYGHWIQVDFGKPTLITAVTTKGSSSANEYLTEYYLTYSYDTPYNFQPYTKPGSKDLRVCISSLCFVGI